MSLQTYETNPKVGNGSIPESGDSARTEREARPEREALLETAEPDILDVQVTGC